MTSAGKRGESGVAAGLLVHKSVFCRMNSVLYPCATLRALQVWAVNNLGVMRPSLTQLGGYSAGQLNTHRL